MRFLSRLLDILYPPRNTEALVREVTLEHVLPLMRPIVRTIDGHHLTALLPYRHPLVRALIIEAKFKGNRHATELLGAVLREYMHTRSMATIIPIPLGATRMRERGYNQVEAIANAAGIPVATHLLTRTRETLPQTALRGGARRRNVAHAFIAEICDANGTYIVLDDVSTTGATLRDAARALETAGARHIEMLALAH